MRLRLGLAAVFVMVLLAGRAFGQATVSGAVVFGTSAKPVPGVQVHLVNKSMKPQVDKVIMTDDLGKYEFDDITYGTEYAVAVYDPTGKPVGTDTTFSVSESDPIHVALPDIDISRGLTQERANKSGGLIQNDVSVSPGANISNEQVRVLPLYNRNFLNLGLIQPGVHDVEQGSSLQGAGFSIAGSRSSSTNFLLDGVDNVASNNNQAIPFQVNEAVREFRVVYATPSLRYGQGSGGIVDVVTSSGDTGSAGKGFHGSVFGYFNNDSLNAGSPISAYSNSGFARAAAFANSPDPTASSVIYFDTNQSAGTPTNCNAISSATAAYCGYSPQSYNALFNLLSPASSVNVLKGGVACNTALCAAGAFNPAALLTSQNSNVLPTTSKQFGGSVGGPFGKHAFLFGSYEGTLIDNPTPTFERVPTFLDRTTIATLGSGAGTDQGIAQSMLGLFPAANVGQTGTSLTSNTNAGILGFYRGLAPNYTHVQTVQFRPDVPLGKYGSLTFRYTGQLLDQLHDDTLPASSVYPGNGANRKAQNQSAAVSHNVQFGQSRNILSIGFTQYRVDEVAQDRGFNVASLGLGATAMPSVVISGIDPQSTAVQPNAGTIAAVPKTQGYVGGWYDSFWQTCTPGGGISLCGATGTVQSPSPITPSLDGSFPLARLGAPLSAPSKRRDTEAFLSDVLELRLGNRNTLTVGGDYRYQQNFSYEGGIARGLIVSNNIGEFAHDSETCVSCATRSAFTHPSFDYELRQPSGYTGDLRSSSYGGFAEEQFRPKERMTLTAGFRYEYFGQQLDTLNRLYNYSLANGGLNHQGNFGTFDAFNYQCGGGTTFFDAVYGGLRASTPSNGALCTPGNFQLPDSKNNATGLFGFAYAPDAASRHVLRVSAGGYYDHAPASYNQKLLQNRPSPYNVADPSAIYGQNFASAFGSPTCQTGTQCSFGLSTLNFATFGNSSTASSTFQNYQAASGAGVLYARDPKALQTPYLIQFAGSYQYRFSNSWNSEIGYVGSRGSQLPLVYDGNFSTEFYCQSNGVCSNSTYFPVFTQSNIGDSNYHSAVVRVEGRLWHGLSMHASYTYAKSLDNIASSDFPNATDSLFSQLYGRQLYGLGNPAVFALQQSTSGYGSNNGLRGAQLSGIPNARTALLQSANIPSFSAIQSALTTTGNRAVNTSHYNLPQNPLAFTSNGAVHGEDHGRSDFDVKQRGVADFVYHLPFRGKFTKDFIVSGITTVQSGQPFSIFSGPAYGQVTQRVNFTSSIATTGNPNGYVTGVGRGNLPSLSSATCPTLYAQPSLYKFSSNQAACGGNSGRNAFTGPAYFSQDIAVQKAITMEKYGLTLRAEFFNLFNRANYYNPISEISADGVHLNPEFGLVRSAHDPRQIQLAARFSF